MTRYTSAGATEGESFGLPTRVFMYTLDQIAMQLAMSEDLLKAQLIYFVGRSTGVPSIDSIKAQNLAPRHAAPIWRVSEKEFIRWLRHKGFKLYERGNAV